MKIQRGTGNGERGKTEVLHRAEISAFRLPRSAFALAFTLVEVIAAITILALITGSVYALLRQSFQAAADLQQAEREDQALRHFLNLCRVTLETLPPDATLSLSTAEETGTAQELTLSGVPEAFSVGPEPVAASDLILGLRMVDTEESREVSNPVYEVAISREEFAPKAEDGDFQIRAGSDDNFYQPDEQGRYWLPLLPGVRSLEWRYWNEENRLWEDDWSNAPDRPALLEMQLWPETRAAPLRVVFSLPVDSSAGVASTDAADTAMPGSTANDGNSAAPNTPGGPPNSGGRRRNADGSREGGRDSGARPPGDERGRNGSGNRRSGNDRGRGGSDQPRDSRDRGTMPQNPRPAPATPGSPAAPRLPVPGVLPR